MDIIAGPDSPLVAQWVASRIDGIQGLPGGFEALGVVDSKGDLRGGVIYTNYQKCHPTGGNIEMWAAGEGNWLTRTVIHRLFAYPFVQLDCHRITLKVAKSNKPTRRFVKHLGFKEEGTHPEALGPGRDMISYGMLRKDCRWLQEIGHEQEG